jgi:hypothetical protein
MLICGVIDAATMIWKADMLTVAYLSNRITNLGIAINALILVMFVLGVLRLVLLLMRYTREENAITRMLKNLQKQEGNPLRAVPAGSIISQRYQLMQRLHDTHTPINHSAMASTLLSGESTKTSLPRFINNVLILTGVFGTIVSLSLALVGASNMLENAVDIGGMGLVVHGMSTALSTTMTAIGCYFYFGYFYFKTTDAQTNLITGIEEITTHFLIPRFQVQTDTVVHQFSGLLRGLQLLVKQMNTAQQNFTEMEQSMAKTLDELRHQAQSLPDEMNDVKRVLRAGFRLRDEE